MFNTIVLKTHNTSSTNKLTINFTHISNKTPQLINDCFATPQYVFAEAQPRQALRSCLPGLLPFSLPSCLKMKLSFPLKFLEAAPSIYNFFDSSLSKFYRASSCTIHLNVTGLRIQHSLFFSLEVHISYMGGEDQSLTPLSMWPLCRPQMKCLRSRTHNDMLHCNIQKLLKLTLPFHSGSISLLCPTRLYKEANLHIVYTHSKFTTGCFTAQLT
jgi:hypothetical protein